MSALFLPQMGDVGVAPSDADYFTSPQPVDQPLSPHGAKVGPMNSFFLSFFLINLVMKTSLELIYIFFLCCMKIS